MLVVKDIMLLVSGLLVVAVVVLVLLVVKAQTPLPEMVVLEYKI